MTRNVELAETGQSDAQSSADNSTIIPLAMELQASEPIILASVSLEPTQQLDSTIFGGSKERNTLKLEGRVGDNIVYGPKYIACGGLLSALAINKAKRVTYNSYFGSLAR